MILWPIPLAGQRGAMPVPVGGVDQPKGPSPRLPGYPAAGH